jgi:ABC-type Mn2+/Zn2+ transport system ATPase subunit
MKSELEARADRTLIALEGVAMGYGRAPILSGIDLALGAGDFLGLIGPNGAGKSTLLKTMLGILPPVAGRVRRRRDLRVGYVPQHSRIDPIFPLTAREVVRSGGIGTKPPGSGRLRLASSSREEAEEALTRLGIAHLGDRPLRDLSGGQQQRVLIARALVRRPDLLVLDEPTAGMDIPSEQELLDFVTALSRDEGLAVLLVVHQISLAAGRARRIAIVNKDLPIFAAGAADEILEDDRLSELYRHPMLVRRDAAQGHVYVRAGRRADP